VEDGPSTAGWRTPQRPLHPRFPRGAHRCAGAAREGKPRRRRVRELPGRQRPPGPIGQLITLSSLTPRIRSTRLTREGDTWPGTRRDLSVEQPARYVRMPVRGLRGPVPQRGRPEPDPAAPLPKARRRWQGVDESDPACQASWIRASCGKYVLSGGIRCRARRPRRTRARPRGVEGRRVTDPAVVTHACRTRHNGAGTTERIGSRVSRASSPEPSLPSERRKACPGCSGPRATSASHCLAAIVHRVSSCEEPNSLATVREPASRTSPTNIE